MENFTRIMSRNEAIPKFRNDYGLIAVWETRPKSKLSGLLSPFKSGFKDIASLSRSSDQFIK